ncbi:hypothetical protein BDN70DRAFT_879493 [Pholiota conissans]|uniref:Uncharacterized protein n=1 Tax=Pholiota conissans TaxID=109636 RepID=A0A9P6CZX3_9AGAR|nr:hypothetical protein BDN70DRAFT_879493 [Pholiota conissans]
MHIFKRTKSIASKFSDRPSDPVANPTTLSSSRAPLIPQANTTFDPLNHGTSSKYTASSSDRPPMDNVAERSTGKDHSHRDADEAKSVQSAPNRTPNSAPPSRVSPRSTPKIEYKIDPDMYTQNDLNTFSFGAAPSTRPSSSSSQLVDPLSRPRDEADSDEVVLNPDTTPRPSVVGSVLHRTHPSHSSRSDVWPSPPRYRQPERGARAAEKSREADSDTTSTFDTSSASASVSSLTRPRGKSSRSASQISGRSNETPQTSANDLTSDEEMDGRHPFPPGTLESSIPRGFRNREQESSLYLSEEDFDNYNDDFDHDDAEIDPSNDASSRSSYFNNIGQSERRGSVARDIPNAQGDKADKYARRPSRSMEELSAFSFLNNTDISRGGHGVDERSLAIAPTSVPESHADWRDLRKKSIQRDKDLPPILNSPSMASGSNSNLNTSAAISNSSASSNDLQLQWMQTYGVNGLVALDSSDMSDIVGEGNIDGRRQSYTAFRKGSNATYRRQSTVSSVDIFNKRILGWGGNTFNGQRHMWTFKREKDPAAEDLMTTRPSDGGKTRSSVSTLFSSRPSTSDGTELSSTVSRTFFDKSSNKDKEKSGKEKGSGKDKPSKEPWKGMTLDSEETWHNGAIGKFKILRKNMISNEPGKPPQQRLNITFIRTTYMYNSTQSEHFLDGPAITIHKHSKAGAFSISRHFRHRPAVGPNSTTTSLRSRNSSSAIGTSVETDGRKKSNTMILLGSRRVQYEYTSTNTTRKLESHGLLDESGRTSPRDVERMRREYEREERARKEKERERERQKRDKGKEKEHSKRKLAESSSKAIGSRNDSKSRAALPLEQPLPDSSEGSAGSIVSPISSSSGSGPTATTPNVSQGSRSTASVSPPNNLQSSNTSYETTSDRTITRNAYRSHPRKRGVYDIDQDMDDEDDSSDERPKYPARTPHREAYASLPPEVFETAQHENPSHGLFGWGKARGTDRHGNRVNPYLEASYNPPWPTTLPRSNSETRKFIVDDLNTSFQDVGLLPATGEIKGSSHQQKRRHRDQKPPKQVKGLTTQTRVDPFEKVPADALYMLLPLWPGETDPVSAKIFPFTPTPIPVSKRQYLMVYYKTFHGANPEENSKAKTAEKKRSRDSPSNSGDHERNIFLSSFHISARIVAYHDFQGSGIRIPDLGLAVSGRLEEAYMTMPNVPPLDDYVIGMCHSRENGIEFIPEGFEKLGLVSHVPNRSVTEPHNEEDDRSSDSMVMVLTPMGRAVMEMAWLGGMAVTSFNPNL